MLYNILLILSKNLDLKYPFTSTYTLLLWVRFPKFGNKLRSYNIHIYILKFKISKGKQINQLLSLLYKSW